MNGNVYVIKAGEDGPVKIGYSENPESRLYQLQGAHHEPLTIVLQFPGFRMHEERAQERARALGLHLRGEWFTDSPDLRSALDEVRHDARQRLICTKAQTEFERAAKSAATRLIESQDILEPFNRDAVHAAFAEAADTFVAAMELFRRDLLEYIDEVRAETEAHQAVSA